MVEQLQLQQIYCFASPKGIYYLCRTRLGEVERECEMRLSSQAVERAREVAGLRQQVLAEVGHLH